MVLDNIEQLPKTATTQHLAVFYQPKIDLKNGRICGFEALLRLTPEHPEANLSVYAFICQAELKGHIQEIGQWVLTQVALDLSQWKAQGLHAPRIAVNVSQHQLQSDAFVTFLKALMIKHPVIQGHLEIEITENTLIQHIEQCAARLNAIQALGIKVSIDDFGTGYSSLAYLKKLPINTLKIDQSFMRDMVSNPSDAVLVRTMISMAHDLGMRVVAEGVEETSQLNLLKKLHCDEVQGFLFSQAMPPEHLVAYVHQFQPVPASHHPNGGALPTILLVDDESNITSAIKRLLRGEKYQVLTANSGKEGLEVMANHHVAVVISDQRMPEMTGVEFLRAVKVVYPETIRIVLSGYTDLRSITDAINEGAIYKFLTKPWEDEALLMNIHEAFQIHALKIDNKRLTEEIQIANTELSLLNKDLEKYAITKMEETKRSMNSLQVFHDIIQTIPIPMLGIDHDGLIVMENNQALAALNLTSSMMGCMAEDMPQLQYPLLSCLQSGEEINLWLADQSYRVLCQTIGAIKGVGKVFYFVANLPHSKPGEHT